MQCLVLKQATDLHSSAFDQHLILEFLQQGFLPAHLQRLKSAYAAKNEYDGRYTRFQTDG